MYVKPSPCHIDIHNMRPAVKDVDWNTWFYGCGLPLMPEVDSRMAKEVRYYFELWSALGLVFV